MRGRRVRNLTGAAVVAAALALMAPAAWADTVTDWNVNATDALITTAGQAPTVSTLHLAMVHGAIYDAVNSIDGRYEPYLVKIRARRWYSQDAAAATAGYRVLSTLLPAQAANLLSLYNSSLASVPAGRARDGGVMIGEIAAAAMLAARANDGRFGPYRFPAPATTTEPWPVGQWRPTLPLFVNDPNAWVKDVMPFLIDDPARFTNAAPKALTSRRYAREFNEVKRLGSATSTSRTADQTDAARFWAEGPLIWTRVTRELSRTRQIPLADNARLYARLYLAGADTFISCWTSKARWLFWRPITAIQQAEFDGNDDTADDDAWVPLINTPPYPDQPSGLSCISGSIATTLADFFRTDRIAFTERSNSSGTSRSFRGFSDAVREIVDARVWSGLHFRTADVDGARLGARVAGFWNRNAFAPAFGHGR
jgi:hypothetical protein